MRDAPSHKEGWHLVDSNWVDKDDQPLDLDHLPTPDEHLTARVYIGYGYNKERVWESIAYHDWYVDNIEERGWHRPGSPSPDENREREEQAAREREARTARLEALRDAATTRKRFITEILQRKTLPKDATIAIARGLAELVGGELDDGVDSEGTMVELLTGTEGTDETVSSWLTNHLPKAECVSLAYVAVHNEDVAWSVAMGYPDPVEQAITRAWFEQLERWGYQPNDLERDTYLAAPSDDED